MTPAGTRSRLFGLIRPYSAVFSAGLVLAAVGSLFDAGMVIVLVPLLKQLFGNAGPLSLGNTRLEGDINHWLAPLLDGVPHGEQTLRLLILFVATVLLKNVAVYVSAYLSVLVQEGVVRDLRVKLYDHLLRLDLGTVQRTRGGQIAAALVSDADQVKTMVSAVLAQFFQNAVMIVATFVVLIRMSPRLTVLVLACTPILLVGVQSLVKKLKRHAYAFTHERGELTATISERIGAVKLIRASGAEAFEASHFRDQAQRYLKGIVRTQRFALLTSPVSELFGATMILLILWAATNASISHVQLDSSLTLLFVVAALRMMSPLKALTTVPATLAQAEASAARVFALLDLPASEIDAPGARQAAFNHELALRHVTFGYEPATPVLRDVSLTVRKGELVALVGPSGSGKTTLLELVPRFHDPQQGSVTLDGTPLPELTRASLRDLIAVVSQDTVILHDTVRANIAYGRTDATEAAITAAAIAANAHEFIVHLPDRYQTILGERGTRLSGGQRQRIAIARALLRDAPILILDEATSALDTESERLVQEAIDRLVRDRTVLVIAHRLATVREADRIVVLDDGQVVESGTHAELLARGGLYRRLHDLQFSAHEVAT